MIYYVLYTYWLTQSKYRLTQSKYRLNMSRKQFSNGHRQESPLLLYGGKKDEELEVRYTVPDSSYFVNLLMANNTSDLQHTVIVDAVEYKNECKRCLRYVKEGNVTRKEAIVKHTKARMPLLLGDLVLSTESKVNTDDVNLPRFAEASMKHRFSRPIGNGWILDLDVTRLEDNQNSGLKNTVKEFISMSPNDVLQSIASYPNMYKYKAELEHVNKGDVKSLSVDSINKMVQNVLSKASNSANRQLEYINELKVIALAMEISNSAIESICNEPTTKFLLPQVKDLTRMDYINIYPPKDYFLTEKADGYRTLISIRNNKIRLLHKDYEEYPISYTQGLIVAEAEYVTCRDGSKLLLIFDVLVYNNELITKRVLDSRIPYISQIIPYFSTVTTLTAKSKEYVNLSNVELYEKSFKGVYDISRQYDIDGIILTQRDQVYKHTTTYKWKPRHSQTADFLVRKATSKQSNLQVPSKTLYILFVSINRHERNKIGLPYVQGYGELFGYLKSDGSNHRIIPIQFSTPIAPHAYLFWSDRSDLDGKIVELGISESIYINVNRSSDGMYIDWKFIKIREDREKIDGKYYGNNYTTSLNILLNNIDEFKFETLYEGVKSDVYFMESKSTAYYAQTAFISYIKGMLINTIDSKNSVLDISSGKGQDLFRYIKLGIKSLTVSDVDKTAIVQLLRRWTDMYRDHNYRDRVETTLKAIVMNVNDKADDNVRLIRSYDIDTYDNIVCNLAVHYFMESADTVDNFAKLCSMMTTPGSKLIITCMFGHRVFDQLKRGDFILAENGTVKYSIMKKYSDSSMALFGQKIAVKLPFSKGEHIDEYLVNTEYLSNVLNTYGFMKLKEETTDIHLPNFMVDNPKVYGQMTDSDKLYVSLYGYLIYRRFDI